MKFSTLIRGITFMVAMPLVFIGGNKVILDQIADGQLQQLSMEVARGFGLETHAVTSVRNETVTTFTFPDSETLVCTDLKRAKVSEPWQATNCVFSGNLTDFVEVDVGTGLVWEDETEREASLTTKMLVLPIREELTR